MDDTQVVGQRPVETETTEASSPQAESPITGGETMKEEPVVQTPVSEESDVSNTMTLEQRKAFQEQRLENKRLKEEIEARAKGESAFNVFRAPQPPVQSQPIAVEQFTDPITGETNWQAYNSAQQQREQQILQTAKYEARAEVQEVMDETNARTKYPEVMGNAKLEKRVAAEWMYHKLQGNNVSVTDIAAEYARDLKQAVSKAEKVGADRALNEVSEKEKAGLVAESQSSQASNRASSQEETERLISSSRRGDYDAVAARISKIPWANK